jgi:uncharacterized membrane protein
VIVATFAYSAAGLYTVGESGERRTDSYPQLAVTFAIVLLFASLGALIFFLDHLAHSIQIDRLMAGIERATIQVINEEPPGLCPGSGPGEAPGPPVWAVAIRARRRCGDLVLAPPMTRRPPGRITRRTSRVSTRDQRP